VFVNKQEQFNNSQIANKLGISEPTVRKMEK
jgi:Mn-dependent DtxR family transcriptional regulator